MNKGIWKIFLSSGLQAIAVQILSILFFFIVSVYLPTESFGIITWANYVSVTITTFLSFGLEQVITRRIAVSERSDWTAAAYLVHALCGSIIAFLVLLLLSRWKSDTIALTYLPWFFVAQAIMYIASPLKQYLNAKQEFGPYGVIAVVSNVLKIGLSFFLLYRQLLSVHTVYIILIICAFFEMLMLYIYIQRKKSINFKIKKNAYVKLIKEASPIYITSIFDAILKRADTILLGIISTTLITGEYGFAYRAFEISSLPVIIIGPIILAKFAKNISGINGLADNREEPLSALFRIEIFISMLIPLIANILWIPLVGYCTKGKFGSVNADQFLLLSVCIPFFFAINLFWTLCFTRKNYRHISFVTLVSAVCNIILNLLFIPKLGGNGAAVAFIITTIIQAVLYYKKVREEIVKLPIFSFWVFLILAATAYFIAVNLQFPVMIRLLIAITIYLSLSVLLQQIKRHHLLTVKLFLKK